MGRQKKEFSFLQKIPLSFIGTHESAGEAPVQQDTVDQIAQSMQGQGLKEPVLVTELEAPNRYRLVVGRKRLLAARKLNWADLDCIVLGRTYQQELRVIERLQGGAFDPMELADTLQRLKEQCDWTQAHLGFAIGKTRDFVANILAITQIAPDVRQHILQHQNGTALTARHLRYVARAPRDQQMQVARQIMEEHLSTKSLERQKHSLALRNPEHEFIRVRELRRTGTPLMPRSLKDWRRYYRQLTTDLRRVDRQEAAEARRAQELLAQARLRKRIIKREANQKRRVLARELRQARKNMARIGMF